jgi:hypothetical protein
VLDPRLLALQGLGVPLSPIAAAVQGLIEQIQEEARKREEEVRGNGRRSKTAENGWNRRESDALTEETVRAQWDLLEARLQAQARPDTAPAPTQQAEPAPAAKKQPDPPAAPAADDLQAELLADLLAAQQAQLDAAAALEDDEDLALAALLAQIV